MPAKDRWLAMKARSVAAAAASSTFWAVAEAEITGAGAGASIGSVAAKTWAHSSEAVMPAASMISVVRTIEGRSGLGVLAVISVSIGLRLARGAVFDGGNI